MIVFVHACDLWLEGLIPLGATAALIGVALQVLIAIVRRRRNRQDAADRLDTVHFAFLVDERCHHLGLRSSSAWAKKAAALRKISLARLSSRFSRSSSLKRAASSLVVPGRFPVSTSILLSHERSVSGVQPIFAATDCIAAQRDLCSCSPVSTIRTARSRTSGEYPGRLFHGLILSRKLASDKLGVIHIGHPKGGSLSFSLHDNLLLDHEKPKIHYRSPTEGGSSGSPVFNDKWDLIGLHHLGGNFIKMLNGKNGHYEANEGIWIQSVISDIKKQVAT